MKESRICALIKKILRMPEYRNFNINKKSLAISSYNRSTVLSMLQSIILYVLLVVMIFFVGGLYLLMYGFNGISTFFGAMSVVVSFLIFISYIVLFFYFYWYCLKKDPSLLRSEEHIEHLAQIDKAEYSITASEDTSILQVISPKKQEKENV